MLRTEQDKKVHITFIVSIHPSIYLGVFIYELQWVSPITFFFSMDGKNRKTDVDGLNGTYCWLLIEFFIVLKKDTFKLLSLNAFYVGKFLSWTCVNGNKIFLLSALCLFDD